jgi:transposase InsO family protein
MCYRCGKLGHTSRYCLAPSSVVQQSPKSEMGAHVEELAADPDDETIQVALEALALEEDHEWIIDSGASRHFSGNAQVFNSLEPSSLGGTAVSAGGHSHPIQGQGSINLSSSNGEIKRISSVYYVPGLNRNLLSVGQIAELGCLVMFDEEKCIVATKTKPSRVIARGKRNPSNGLYFLRSESSNLELNSLTLDLSSQVSYPSEPTLSTQVGTSNSLDLQANTGIWNPRTDPTVSTVERPRIEEQSRVSTSADAFLWHRRMGHLNYQYLAQLSKQAIGLPNIPAPNGTKHCDQCHAGKSSRSNIPKRATVRSEGTLDLIHSDLCGPLPIESLSRARYYISFTDDFSRKTWIYFLVSKDQAFEKFRLFKTMIEKATGRTIKTLRTDRGGEYLSSAFSEFCQEAGIHRQLTAAHTPHQNGLAECRNRSILEKTRSMMLGAGVPNYLWAETAKTAVYLLNRSPTKANLGATPEECFTKQRPDLRHLRTFGCLTHLHIQKNQRNKLEARSERGVLVGYDESTKGYRIWLPHKRIVTVSRDVSFDETRFYRTNLSEVEFDVQPLLESQPLSPLTEDLLLSGMAH